MSYDSRHWAVHLRPRPQPQHVDHSNLGTASSRMNELSSACSRARTILRVSECSRGGREEEVDEA
jgi:hypothetical protein